MKELQERVEHLQCENDRLRSQVEKDTQDSGQAKHPVVRDKGKKPTVLNDVDPPADDELSSGSSPNLSPAKKQKQQR